MIVTALAYWLHTYIELKGFFFCIYLLEMFLIAHKSTCKQKLSDAAYLYSQSYIGTILLYN